MKIALRRLQARILKSHTIAEMDMLLTRTIKNLALPQGERAAAVVEGVRTVEGNAMELQAKKPFSVAGPHLYHRYPLSS
jgi:hypothetical protein